MHLLLLLAATLAAPTWPEGATPDLSTNQLLYDAPATTEEELLRRQGLVGVHLRWPGAEGAAGYEVFVRGERVERLPADARAWSGRAKEGAEVRVVAVDAQGQGSEALRVTVPALAPFASAEGGVLAMLGSSSSGDVGMIFANSDDVELSNLLGEPAPVSEQEAPAPRATLSTVDLALAEGQQDAGVRDSLTALETPFAYCLRLDDSLPNTGALTLSFRVNARGRVEGVEVKGLTTGSQSCVERKLLRASLPEQAPGDVSWALSW